MEEQEPVDAQAAAVTTFLHSNIVDELDKLEQQMRSPKANVAFSISYQGTGDAGSN